MKKKWYNMKLSIKIAMILFLVVVLSFLTLILVFNNIMTTELNAGAISMYSKEAEQKATLVEGIFDKNIFALESLAEYIPELMDEDDNAILEITSNNDEEDEVKEELKIRSRVTLDVISQNEFKVENYIIQSLHNNMGSLDDFTGMGVYFEPRFFKNIHSGYGVYMNEELANNNDFKKELSLGKYSDEEFYIKTKNSNDLYISETYTDTNGNQVISISAPIIYKGSFVGVVKADLSIDAFSGVAVHDERYSSLFSDLYSENLNIIYDPFDSEVYAGHSIYEYILYENEAELMRQNIVTKEEFYITATREDGGEVYRFMSPINVRDKTLWSMVGIYKRDLTAIERRAVIITAIISLIATLVCILAIFVVVSKYLKPLKKLEESAEQIVLGNFDIKNEVKSGDEIGKLSNSFNQMALNLNYIITDIGDSLDTMAIGNFNVESEHTDKYVGKFEVILSSMKKITTDLSAMVDEVRVSAMQVNSGSEQVSSASQTLSQGSTEQAASVEELSATINEITDQTKLNVEFSKIGKESADEAKVAIEDIGYKMDDLTKAMAKISAKSEEIGNIIKTIDSIAFQTNILALNAAVEAARAGDAGKGFAVVADEVRNLAAKSAGAAKDTALLIEETVLAVNEGMEHVESTNTAMDKVTKITETMSENVDKISESSENQLASVNEILIGSEEISSVVQANSATSEETAAASEELSSQSTMLIEMMEKFKTKEN